MKERKGPENLSFLGGRIDNYIESDKHLDTSYQKAQEILKNKISERDFDNLYGKDKVDHDLQYVYEHLMIFKSNLAENPDKRKNKKFATILEAIFTERVSSGTWFGSNVGVIIPSRYDEIKNGIDSIMKFQEVGKPSSYLALGIDVTFSKDADSKIHNILNKIRKGESSEIKYFKTKEFKGQLLNIPKVVIGIDKKTVQELSFFWNNNENDKIDNHPVQQEILSQIIMQLEKFGKECKKNNRNDLAERYNHALLIIQEIIKKKGFDPKSIEGGDIYKNIKRYLDTL